MFGRQFRVAMETPRGAEQIHSLPGRFFSVRPSRSVHRPTKASLHQDFMPLIFAARRDQGK